MNKKVQTTIVAFLFFLLVGFAWFKPADKISDSELRPLAQFPKVSAEAVLNGKFMKDFESYALDQFPLRDGFRTIKAYTYLYGMQQKDNNKIYIENDYAAKMEYPLSEESIIHAADRFLYLYNSFIENTGCSCYLAVIPDKNYYLAADHGALSMDYNALIGQLTENTDFASYIDITDQMGIESFYHTDPHWDQTTLAPVANKLAEQMGVSLEDSYSTVTLEAPFYGVYYGQAALPMKPDKMQYLTNTAISSAIVHDRQNNKDIAVYNEAALGTRSPYDLFLGGSLSLITIENPLADNDKELVVFRDSYGSSLAPLLISGYKSITLCDIRYLPSERIGSFIDFHGQDVLFMYSTSVLNNSSTIK